MMRQRPRLKSVIAVLLLWQAASAGVALASEVGPLMSAMPSSPSAVHCSVHSLDVAPVPSATEPDVVAAAFHHPAGSGCCDSGIDCHGLCAHGIAALATQLIAHDQAAICNDAPFEPSAPAGPRRPAEVFRPPI